MARQGRQGLSRLTHARLFDKEKAKQIGTQRHLGLAPGFRPTTVRSNGSRRLISACLWCGRSREVDHERICGACRRKDARKADR